MCRAVNTVPILNVSPPTMPPTIVPTIEPTPGKIAVPIRNPPAAPKDDPAILLTLAIPPIMARFLNSS